MKRSSLISSLTLAGACLLATIDMQAASITRTQAVALGCLIACSYMLIRRETEKDFEPRYSVKKVADVRNLFSREYAQNLWYLFYDGLIGQYGKKYKDAHGVFGVTYYYVMPLKKAAGNVAFGYFIYRMGIKVDKLIAKMAKVKDDTSEPAPPENN